MPEPDSVDPKSALDPEEGPVQVPAEDAGPGWMPAILAATLLMAMAGFICCGVSTYFIFQKRGELALRTLEGNLIPTIEQSRIEPEQKAGLVKMLKEFSSQIKRGNIENWQAAGVMQRLQRMPIFQWGELAAVEAFVDSNWQAEQRDNALKQLSRLRRSVETEQTTVFDVEEVLKPVLQSDEGAYGRKLIEPLMSDAVAETINRAASTADRADVPDKLFTDIRIDVLVQREIDKGIAEGTY